MTAPAPSDQAPAVAATTPGWYPDPWQRHQRRFHDGAQWTEHVADGGFSGLDTEPVADMPRSRPHPVRETPPQGAGPRVLAVGETPAGTLEAPLLLVDERAGPGGHRDLRAIDDSTVGSIEAPRPAWPRRLVRSIVTSPSTTLTLLVVRDADGAERLRVRRPRRRIAAVVDIEGPSGRRGSIEADRVRQGLRAVVRTAAGEQVGVLEQTGREATSRRIVDADGAVLARLTAVWDVPGPRVHLPPGVLLLDRSTGDDAAPPDPGRADLLLGALVAADLLAPPPPPRDR